LASLCNAVCIVAHQVVKLLEVNCEFPASGGGLTNKYQWQVFFFFYWFVLKDANRLEVILDVWIKLQLANICHLLCFKHDD
jgi:hypothetical protein